MRDVDSGGRRYLFLLGSARANGNTEMLARRAAAALPKDTDQVWVNLRDLVLPAFEDLRHRGDGSYPRPGGDEGILVDATMGATDIVLVSPMYWYTVSTATKLYLDYWSGWLRVPGMNFKQVMTTKTLRAVVTYAGDRAKTAPVVDTLRLCAEFFPMRWGGALIGNGSRPGDVLSDSDAMAQVKTFLVGGFAGTTVAGTTVAGTTVAGTTVAGRTV